MIFIKYKECCERCENLEVKCNYGHLENEPFTMIGCSHMDVCSEFKKASREELEQNWGCNAIKCGRLTKTERNDNPLKEQCDVQTRMVVHKCLSKR